MPLSTCILGSILSGTGQQLPTNSPNAWAPASGAEIKWTGWYPASRTSDTLSPSPWPGHRVSIRATIDAYLNVTSCCCCQSRFWGRKTTRTPIDGKPGPREAHQAKSHTTAQHRTSLRTRAQCKYRIEAAIQRGVPLSLTTLPAGRNSLGSNPFEQWMPLPLLVYPQGSHLPMLLLKAWDHHRQWLRGCDLVSCPSPQLFPFSEWGMISIVIQ